MTPEEILEHMEENCDEAVIRLEGLDDALVGWANPWDTSGITPTRLIYSAAKCIKIMMDNQGLSEDDAIEWLSYNTENCYLGEHTPIIMHGHY